jgi:hypothetical protein
MIVHSFSVGMEVERAARSGEKLIPRIIAAVEAYAMLGEVADAMRRVFGEYSEAIWTAAKPVMAKWPWLPATVIIGLEVK